MVVDLSPLLRGAAGDEIRVAGVVVGDRAAQIDRAALTGAEEKEPGEPRIYRNDKVYRKATDGREVEVPLDERIEATLRKGGFLRCQDIALGVNEGAIDRIFVRGSSLETLGIIGEEAISAAFGPAEGHERKLGWHVHHYPTRRLAIAWEARGDRIEHVALGSTDWKEPRLGARALLEELLGAFPALARAGWEEPAEGSMKVRYGRIAALSSALGLGTPADLVKGSFLDSDAVDPRYQPLLDELAKRAPDSRRRSARGWTIRMLFGNLLHYRVDVERVVRAGSGWLECSDPVLLGMIGEQSRIGAELTGLVADVERWLCTLMDPAGRSFELRDLIACHAWPDVDLQQLEIDEF